MNVDQVKSALGLNDASGKVQCPNCETDQSFSVKEFNGDPVFKCDNGCSQEELENVVGMILNLKTGDEEVDAASEPEPPAIEQVEPQPKRLEITPVDTSPEQVKPIEPKAVDMAPDDSNPNQPQKTVSPKRLAIAEFEPNTDDLDNDAGRNDNSNATRFVDEFYNVIRFVPDWNKWLVWDKRRWKIDVGDIAVTKLARRYAEGLWNLIGVIAQKGAARDELGKAQTFVRKSNDSNAISAMIRLAKSDDRVAVGVDSLNSNPYLLNVKNGTIDLKTGELKPHCQEDLITQLANVEFDKNAKCPNWKETLKIIFDSDFELIEYVQKLVGYSASGDTGEHILPICYGSGENGKSTLWNPIVSILGEYAGLASESLLLGYKNEHPTGKAQLYQKRFVPVSEPPEGSRLKESLVKELTGDDIVTARKMGQDFWSFKRTHTFWMSTNHLPQIKGTDNGIWRRIKLIPFNVRIRAKVKEVRKDFVKELIANESSGILNWIVMGFRKWLAEGLEEPKAVIEATKIYRDDSDELQQFISECCDESNEFVATAKELFESFKDWNPDSKITKTKFGKDIVKRFQKNRPTSGPYRSKTIYRGIQLKEMAERF